MVDVCMDMCVVHCLFIPALFDELNSSRMDKLRLIF